MATDMQRAAADTDPAGNIRHSVHQRLSHRHAQRRTWAVIGVAAAVAATVTAVAFLAPSARDRSTAGTRDPQTVGSSARCYATARLDASERNFLSVTLVDQSGAGILTGTQALDICRGDWLSGTLSTTEPYIVDNPQGTADPVVPNLVLCVIPAGDEGTPEIAVIPGNSSTCSAIGLVTYTG